MIPKISFLIFFFLLNQALAQNPSSYLITIYSCETGVQYKLRNDSLFLASERGSSDGKYQVIMAYKINDSERMSVKNAISTIMRNTEDEIFINPCVDDGFHLKIYVRKDKVKKKVFVGNYYDERIDSLTGLFDKCLLKNKIDMVAYSIGYGSKESRDRIIQSQNLCCQKITPDYRKSLIDLWCEINEK
ncbi:MAG: hypothetical protein IPN29_20430 [Saprospiraceae bacterium]|nr:hypothetical protein [Saprospiraceae bacterium]